MTRLREEVNRWPISPERRARVLAGVGPPLWRAIERREVRTRGELATVVRGLIRRLQEAEGISGDLRTACRYGRWVVREALAEARVTPSLRFAWDETRGYPPGGVAARTEMSPLGAGRRRER